MMDTSTEDTLCFHPELQSAMNKLQKREDRAEAHGGFGSTLGGRAIASQFIAQVTAGVVSRFQSERPRSNTYAFRFQRLMMQLPPETIALAILQAGLYSATLGDNSTLRAVLVRIGAALNNELWAKQLLKTNPKLHAKIEKAVKARHSSAERRLKAAKDLAAKGDANGNSFVFQEWSTKELIHAGHWGLTLLQETMPDVFAIDEPVMFRGKSQERVWRITDHGMSMAMAAVQEAVLRSPVYQPRTEAPKNWDTMVMRVAEDDRTLDRAPLIRTFHKDVISAAKHAIRTGAMAPALRGLNALQSVPFTINAWVLDIMVECYNRGIKVDGIPLREPLDIPARKTDAEFKALSVLDRRLLSKTIRGLHRANRANTADTVQFVEDIETAQRLAPVERWFTPMNWDWRTRTYALTRFNFQREDRVRSLFLFANGKPIGEEGIKWLKIHVANCGAFKIEGADGKKVGIDKKSFEERIEWTDANLSRLAALVEDPMGTSTPSSDGISWVEADKPFLFLAACRELISALNTGTAYVTHLPTGWDGSCNGLQHLCLMTRDPNGRLVNLTNNKEPLDVYQVVADLAKQLIEADKGNMELFGKPDDDKPERKTVATLDKLATLALNFGVDRKLVKRNVMTFSYASKEFGMSEQHFEDTMAPLELKLLKKEIEAHPFGEDDDEWRLASRYLAKRVLQAIKTVVNLPAKAMEFMQILAKTLAHEGKPLRWTTPAGVPCINRYHESTSEKVELFCYDKGVKVRTRVTVATGYEKPIAKDKAAAGIAANLTHSMDASHLLLSVGNAVDEGITDIATVHDSFGCLACDAPRFIQIIRETLKRMYEEHDALAELYESAKADLSPAGQERLQNELQNRGFDGPPAKGELDITEVLSARYAFC